MVADAHSYSPGAGKPRAVVESWKRRFVDMEIVAPTPVDAATLSLAHRATARARPPRVSRVPHAKRAVAWKLVGGQQTPLREVLDIRDNTMAECAAAFAASGGSAAD